MFSLMRPHLSSGVLQDISPADGSYLCEVSFMSGDEHETPERSGEERGGQPEAMVSGGGEMLCQYEEGDALHSEGSLPE